MVLMVSCQNASEVIAGTPEFCAFSSVSNDVGCGTTIAPLRAVTLQVVSQSFFIDQSKGGFE